MLAMPAEAGLATLIEEEVAANTSVASILDSSYGVPSKGDEVKLIYQVIVTLLYSFGIAGNVAALAIISRNETKFKKQALMLRCLALNDLLALVGSCVLMHIHAYLPNADQKWLCIFRVMWRAFGLGSGCVSIVMALDRWLALSHSFTYMKYVTQEVVWRSILGLWSFNALLVFAPFVGFGLWYDETKVRPCVRYRYGTSPSERAYAYLVFTFGFTMCVCIVCCNLAVIRVLCGMGQRMITRRYSRASRRGSISQPNAATPDELSFARLMAILSIFFVVCWCPQLLGIIAGQMSLFRPNSHMYKAADILIALNFCLDPYIYVLFRHVTRRSNHTTSDARRCNSPNRSALNGSSQGSKVSYKRREASSSSINKMTGSTTASSEKEYVPLQLLFETSKSEDVKKSEQDTPPTSIHSSSLIDVTESKNCLVSK